MTHFPGAAALPLSKAIPVRSTGQVKPALGVAVEIEAQAYSPAV